MFFENVDVLCYRAGNALQPGAVDLIARVVELKSEDDTLGFAVVDRGALAGEVRQNYQPARTGRNVGSELCERGEGVFSASFLFPDKVGKEGVTHPLR